MDNNNKTIMSLDEMTVLIAEKCFYGDTIEASKIWREIIRGLDFVATDPGHQRALIAACVRFADVNIQIDYWHYEMKPEEQLQECLYQARVKFAKELNKC